MQVKMTKSFFFIGFFLFINKIYGQQPTNPFPANAISASSYNAGTLSSANYYTGQPIINLPIFKYQGNDLAIGVNLNYNGTGTTLEKIASSTGLGWELSGMGYIKREVVGAPDEFKYTVNGVVQQAGYLNNGNVSTTPTRSELNDFYANKRDGELDNYICSIPEYSGKIIIGKNGQVVGTSPESNLTITFNRLSNNGRIYKFIIKTETGITYEFLDAEVLKYKTTIDGVEYIFDYTSTWLLTVMYPTTGYVFPNSINFQYESYSTNETLGKEIFSAAPHDPAVLSGIASVCVFSGCCYFYLSYHNHDVTIEGTLKRISSITLPNGTFVKFNYKANNRCDLASDKALDNVEILNPNNKVEKRYNFEFSYASLNGEVSYNSCSTLDLSKRLLLKSLTEVGNDGNPLPPHQFEYDMTLNLQSRNYSTGYVDWDAWGYYTDHYPVVVDPLNSVKAYVLKKITYPTGSSTSYEYELNTIGWTKAATAVETIRGLRLKKTIVKENSPTPYANNTNPVEIEYSYNNSSGTTSGEVDFKPIISFNNYINYNKLDGNCFSYAPYDLVTMRNQINHSPIQRFPTGNACGYSTVTEEVKSGSEVLGKNVYYFKNFSDYINASSIAGPLGVIEFPFSNKQYNIPWGLGLPIKTESYDNLGKKIKVSENLFNVESHRMTGADVVSLKNGMWWGPQNRDNNTAANGDVYKFDSYYPLTGRTTLIQSSNTNYSYPGSPTSPISIATNVSYEYIQGKNLVRSSSSHDSKGNLIKKIYYYPFDYSLSNPGNSAIPLMNTIGLSTLVVSEETWITKNSINYLVDAYVQDYKAISNGSIKLSKKYILKSIDPIAENLIPAFNSSSLFRDPNLFEEKVSVDNFSLAGNPSQITDNAQTSVSTIYENYGKLAVATVMNAKLTEVAFTSFEDLSPYYPLANELLGNFRLTGVPQRASTISGNQAFQGQVVTTLTTGTYRITYWCNTTGGLSLTASSIIEPQQLIRSTNGWSLYKAIVSITGVTGSITINSGSYLIDEARILPTASRISTINFNDRLLKSSSADDNNVFTYYEYDGFGRLIIVRDHERNIVSKTCYKYNGQIENCTIYFNVQKSGVFTRNNCGPGSVGGTATYVVPTGTYTSSYSQGFADQQAQDDVNLNGQAYANVYGSCTTPTCNSSNCSGDDRKCINGVCEIGTWTSISSVWKKKDGVWQWECVYKYCFSDGSFSTYSLTTYSASSCPMTCFFD